jgi:hypothetical protein
MEVLIQTATLPFTWTIVRPTAMWGPWFEMPYNLFFKTVSRGLYVHTGRKDVTKPNCYVGNGLYMLDKIFELDPERVHKKVFYLVDYPQLSVREWANNIQKELGRWWPIPTFPLSLLYGVGAVGTAVKAATGIELPLTLFRLQNMLTEMRLDTSREEATFGALPFSNTLAVRETLAWLADRRFSRAAKPSAVPGRPTPPRTSCYRAT